MTSPEPERRTPYSPDRRTALVLTGTGADGAYHAGTLRALTEAGVRVDLIAGRGIGAVGAIFAAIDGGARLWAAPMACDATAQFFIGGLWDLLRGGAHVRQPAASDLSRRYAELLAENLGQPGFRELLLIAHDVDARHDVVFALLEPNTRRAFFSR